MNYELLMNILYSIRYVFNTEKKIKSIIFRVTLYDYRQIKDQPIHNTSITNLFES